jgi:hypothetical protein
VSVSDAAGNSTPVVDRQVNIANAAPNQPPAGGSSTGGGPSPEGSSSQGDNPSPGANGTGSPGAGAGGAESRSAASQPEARGAANGTTASEQATLSARWQGTANAHVTNAYGHPRSVSGRLTGPGGRAIAGAVIDVIEQPAYAGAHPSTLHSPHTDAAGRWRVRLPSGICSSVLRFGYRSHLGDTTPVATRTLTLGVHAGLRLNIAPRISSVSHRIRFSGHLQGAPVPIDGKQLVLEARSGKGGWLQFHVIRTDGRGSFHFTYRFHFAGPVNYTFRAVSNYEADYPFLAGISNRVRVRER